MNFLFLLLVTFVGYSAAAQTDSILTRTRIVNNLNLIAAEQSSLNLAGPIQLPIYYYPFYNGVQIIKFDYYSKSLAQGKRDDFLYPRGISSYSIAMYRNTPNGFLVRDMDGKIIHSFNVDKKDLKQLVHPTESEIFHVYHQNRSQVTSQDIQNPNYKSNSEYSGVAYDIYDAEKQLYGLMDTTGSVILEPSVAQITRYSGVYLLKSSKGYTMLNAQFEPVLDQWYSYIERVGNSIYIACENGCTYINSDGSQRDSTVYDEIQLSNKSMSFDTYKLNNKYGLIDDFGNRITEPIYHYISSMENGYFATDSTRKIAILNTDGERITDFIFEQGIPRWRKDGYYQVKVYDRDYKEKGYKFPVRFGLVNEEGKEITGYKYTYVGEFSEGVAEAKIDDSYGIVNQEGEALTEFIYSDIYSLYPDIQYITVRKGRDQFGLLDLNGKVVLPPVYRQIACTQEDMALVRDSSGKLGFLHLDGGTNIDFVYDNAWCFVNGMARVQVNQKRGMINRDGVEITGFQYDYVFDFKSSYTVVKKGEKYGAIDRNGNVVAELKYDEFKWKGDGTIVLKSGAIRKALPPEGK